MENKQAIANIKQGKNIPYKHETISTLVNMADKLEKIEQIVNAELYANGSQGKIEDIKEVLEQE